MSGYKPVIDSFDIIAKIIRKTSNYIFRQNQVCFRVVKTIVNGKLKLQFRNKSALAKNAAFNKSKLAVLHALYFKHFADFAFFYIIDLQTFKSFREKVENNIGVAGVIKMPHYIGFGTTHLIITESYRAVEISSYF